MNAWAKTRFSCYVCKQPCRRFGTRCGACAAAAPKRMITYPCRDCTKPCARKNGRCRPCADKANPQGNGVFGTTAHPPLNWWPGHSDWLDLLHLRAKAGLVPVAKPGLRERFVEVWQRKYAAAS